MRKMRSLFLILGLAGLAYGGWVGWHSEALKLRTVEVGGNEKVDKELIASASELTPGTHLLQLSTSDVADQVKKIPWVLDARVERIVPSKVRITVTERTPVAQVLLLGTSFVADEEGVVLEEGAGTGVVISGLPIDALKAGNRLELAQYRHALEIFGRLQPTLKEKVTLIKAPSVDGIALEFQDSLTVLYGAAEQMKEKNFAIRALLDEAAGRGARLLSIDVRVPRRPSVREA